jgi:RNA polymerase sigma factor (sigma-70 family)
VKAFSEGNEARDRRWVTLERLLGLDATELGSALDEAAQVVAEALAADKVDAFLYEPEGESLVARGTSDTPMGRQQHALGLDRMALVNGGRAAEVFRSGQPHRDGRVDQDLGEIPGIREALGVRSALIVPLEVGGERRGVLAVVSATPDFFVEEDLRFLKAVAHWMSLVMHRAELVEQLVGAAQQQGRREAMEQLLEQLTPRQREVAVLLAAGKSNAEIAEKLVLTPGTVANHVEHILGRLGFENRTQVAALVAELGLHRQELNGAGP